MKVPFEASNDWPMERHDPQMTGRTPLKGNMKSAPSVIWRYYLGLWNNHLVITESSKPSQEIELPKESFGDGYVSENSLNWGMRLPAVDIDGKGTMVNLPNESSAKLAKLLPGIAGYQRIEFDNAFGIGAEANFGRLFAYDNGADKPRLVWQTERVKDMYSPVVAIADTDLDGQDEIILLTHYHLAIYDALTGRIKDSVEWNVGRNYGQLDVVDVDHDGLPDFVIQADAPPHLEFIRNSPDGARLIWSHKYLKDEADVAVPSDFYLNSLPNAVRDLDGDGRIELAVNIRHFKDDRRWHVVIFDVLTGEVKADIPDRYLWAVSDLDSDGCFELFMSEALSKTVERDARLYVSTCNGKEIVDRWESVNPGSFCMKPYFFPDNVNSASSRGPVHHSAIITCDTDKDNCYEFFITVDNSLRAVDFRSHEPKFTIISPSENPPKVITSKSNQVLVELPAESGTVRITNSSFFSKSLSKKPEVVGIGAELKSHYQSKAFRSTPVVADVDGDGSNEIIVEDASGFINVLNPLSEKESIRWRFRAFAQPVWVTWKTQHAPVPVVDLDGDGKKEIICCDAGNEPYTTVYALKSDGSVYWKSEIKEIGPRLTETIKVGKFRSDGWDVIITVLPTTQPEMICLDGRTGDIRWHKRSWSDDNNRLWPYPNRYVCFDSDNDGFHEIYGSYAYIYYALDGKTGEPVYKPINIWQEVFHRWQAYFAPIPADFNGDGKTEFLLASDSYAIGGVTVVTPNSSVDRVETTLDVIWEIPLPNSSGASGLQGIGDCDGDGLPEIAFYHLDGRIVCYNGKTGDIKWRVEGLAYSGGGHFSSGDIDSDGRDEFLYSLGTNEIIALDNDAADHILWRTRLDGNPDTPILADINGDGLCEIIVCTGDGYLNVLK